MNEFAPEYSKRERIAFAIKYLTLGVIVVGLVQYQFLPWLQRYIPTAHCYKYGEITGTEVVFYGLFVGLPLFGAIIMLLLEGPNCIKIIRLGQSPLPGQKVLKPTRYIYGQRAKLKSYFFLLAVLLLLGLAGKGVFWASDTASRIDPNKTLDCTMP